VVAHTYVPRVATVTEDGVDLSDLQGERMPEVLNLDGRWAHSSHSLRLQPLSVASSNLNRFPLFDAAWLSCPVRISVQSVNVGL
jgi:hypothetical protein